MKKVRRAKPRNRQDQKDKKRAPENLAQTFLAVQQHWLQLTGQVDPTESAIGADRFLAVSNFKQCLEDVYRMYPGVKRPSPESKNPQQQLRKAVWNTTIGESELEYYWLRAWAHFTKVRPVGLLLFFAQLVGEEKRAKKEGRNPREACTQLIDAMIRVMERTRTELQGREDGARLFTRLYGSDTHELPDVVMLKLWSDVFNEAPLPPDAFPPTAAS